MPWFTIVVIEPWKKVINALLQPQILPIKDIGSVGYRRRIEIHPLRAYGNT
jgi:hypothetical protein